jgi:hypothetical protein
MTRLPTRGPSETIAYRGATPGAEIAASLVRLRNLAGSEATTATNIGSGMLTVMLLCPYNDKALPQRRTRDNDCNREAHAWFAAAHG